MNHDKLIKGFKPLFIVSGKTINFEYKQLVQDSLFIIKLN